MGLPYILSRETLPPGVKTSKACLRAVGLPDRRICTVKIKNYRTFTFTVKAGGVKVTFVYDTCYLAPVAERLRENATLPLQDLAEIVYRGTSYPRNHLVAQKFIKAVKLNVKPEHVVLIEEHM